MQRQFGFVAESLLKARQKHKRWLNIVSGLMAVVVFITTYAMILPAISMTATSKVLDCHVQVHQHTEDCFDEDNTIICGQADFVVHSHNDYCFDGQGQLVCALPEIKEHVHKDSCYSTRLICGLDEGEGHSHDDSCYDPVLICDKEEIQLHSHSQECYEAVQNEIETENGNQIIEEKQLICGKTEVKEHVHADGCFIADEEAAETEVPEITETSAPVVIPEAAAETEPETEAEVQPETEMVASTSSIYSREAAAAVVLSNIQGEVLDLNETMNGLGQVSTQTPEIEAGKTVYYCIEGNGHTYSVTATGDSGVNVYFYRVYGSGSSLSSVGGQSSSGADSSASYSSYLYTGYTYYIGIKFVNQEYSGTVTVDITRTGNHTYTNNLCKCGVSFYDCGVWPNENLVHWSLTDGVLRFYGEGEIEGFTNTNTKWYSSRTSVKSIVVDEGITAIGNNDFYGSSEAYTALKSVSLPESLEKIGDNAFYNCRKITTLDIPDKVTYIGNSAFYLCSGLTTVTVGDGVETIGNSAFYGCSAMTSISLGSGLKSIGEYAFYNCKFTELILPEGLTSLGKNAVYSCSNLTKLYVPGTVTTMNDYAFASNGALKTVTLGEGLTTIGNYAFNGAAKLETINIPDSVKVIGNNAFYGCSALTAAELPEGLEKIGDNAFYNCSSITTVTVPGSVTYFGASAFAGCTKLEEAVVCQGVTNIGSYGFSGCTKLVNLSLPESLTSIDSYAFNNCRLLTSIELSKSISTIGAGAFQNCTGLTELSLPDKLTVVETNLFSGDTGLTTVNIPENVTQIGSNAFYNCQKLSAIDLPETVTEIGSSAFYQCYALQEISIPEGVTAIKDNTFYRCEALENLTIPSTLTSIGYRAFYQCKLIEEMPIPDSVTSIGQEAFANCTALRKVTWPENIVDIPNKVFSSCSALTEFKFPAALNSIGTEAFSGCKALKSISLPETLTSIGDSAFNGCSTIKRAIIPDSVTYLGSKAFYYCSALQTVKLPKELDTIKSGTFTLCESLANLTLPENLTTIGESAFASCGGLTRLELPDTVTKIDTQAFYNCYGLEEILLPENLVYLGSESFARCFNAKELTLSAPLSTSYYNNAFNYDSSLERIYIRENVTFNFASSIFQNCLSIHDIVVGREINSISGNDLNTLLGLSTNQEKTLHFEGENTFKVTDADVSCGTVNLTIGEYYVNQNGVLYRLEDDGAATLVYCPAEYDKADISSLIEPITLGTGQDSESYTVTKIDSFAFYNNSHITEAVIPETVTQIDGYAFYKCSALAAVNGEITMKGAFSALDSQGTAYQTSAFFSTAIWGAEGNELYAPVQETELAVNDKNNTYEVTVSIAFESGDLVDGTIDTVYTGKTANLSLAIKGTDSSIEDTIRIYFQAEDGCNIYSASTNKIFATGGATGYQLGVEQSFDVNGIKITGVFQAADEPNLYYLEMTGVIPGDTLILQMKGISYPNFTAGGTLSIWADNTQGKDSPKEVVQGKWITKKVNYSIGYGYTVERSGSTSRSYRVFSFKPGTADSPDAYISNEASFTQTASIASYDSGSASYGVNPLKYIECKASIELPEELHWKEGVLEAIQNGNWKCTSKYGTSSSDNSYQYLYAKVDGEWVQLLTVRGRSDGTARALDNCTLSVDENGNLVVGWRRYNPKSSQNLTTNGVTISYCNGVILADADMMLSEMEADNSGKIKLSVYSTLIEANYYYYYNDISIETTPNLQGEIYGEASTGEYKLSKSGTKAYMGNNANYVITLSNDSIFPAVGIDRLTDELTNGSYGHPIAYIKPANIERMFNDTYGSGFSLKITDMLIRADKTRDVITSDGTEGTAIMNYIGESRSAYDVYDYSNADTYVNIVDQCCTKYADISISWSEDHSYFVVDIENKTVETSYKGTTKSTVTTAGESMTVNVGEGQDYASLQQLFDAMNYVVDQGTGYSLNWELDNSQKLYGGEVRKIYVYATYKDTFTYLSTDGIRTNSGNGLDADNTASTYKTGSTTADKRVWTNGVKAMPEMLLDLSATVNGKTLGDTGKLKRGDILDYTNKVTVYKSYSALPLVSRLYEGQVLLVTVEDNPQLQDEGFTVTTVDSVEYYMVDKPGTYHSVTVGNAVADTVEVESSSGGVDTKVFWYMNIRSAYELSFKAIVMPDSTSDNATVNFTVLAVSWLGDHQGHRLYDKISFEGLLITQDLKIVTNAEDSSLTQAEHNPEDDETATISTIEPGERVVYRIELNPRGSKYPVELKSSNMPTTLTLPTAPLNYWTKDNVSVSYVYADGTEGTVTNGDDWSISTVSTEISETSTQVISWGSSFKLSFDDAVYIYVTLQFPEGGTEEWTRYIQLEGSAQLYARLKISDMLSTVEHLMYAESVGVLQTGVYMTGVHSGTSYYYNTAETARMYYANKSTFNNMVMYYVVVYNPGYGRLYLNDIQVVLPEGFTMDYLYAVGTLSNISIYDTETGEKVQGTSSFTPGFTASKTNSSGALDTTADGRLRLTFTPKKGAVNYDSQRDAVYLKSKQFMAITFVVQTNQMEDTQDIATSYATMATYDYCGAGCSLSQGYTILLNDYTGVTQNNGTQEKMSTQEATAQGFSTSVYSSDTLWLNSQVSSMRGKIGPGIQESSVPEETTNKSEVNWTVNFSNSGQQSMTDYTITNVMALPYTYTGNIVYSIKSPVNGSSSTSTGNITLFTASQLPEVGAGEKQFTNTTLGDIYVRLDYNEDESQIIMTIRLPSIKSGIPANGSAVLTFTTNNLTDTYYNKDFINKTYLTPTQKFSRGDVSKGNYVLYNVNDDNDDAVPSVTTEAKVSVSYGYATRSSVSVTELVKTETDGVSAWTVSDNTANSGSGDDSYIVPSSTSNYFRYTLTVNNSGGVNGSPQPMTKFVLMDNLPELGDHSTLYSKFSRDSEFAVKFAPSDVLDFAVTLVNGNSTTELVEGQDYTLVFSEQTNFDYSDTDNSNKSIWEGQITEGWYTLDECIANGTLENMRTVRVIIEDSTKSLMPASVTVNVSFNVSIDINQDAEASESAWNSFGYLYVVPIGTLQAATESVGIKTPGVPEIQKELVLFNGEKYSAYQDETFRFLIFKGDKEDVTGLDSSLGEEKLLEMLSAQSIPATIAEVTVPEGESESQELSLNGLYCYKYNEVSGKWQPDSDSRWIWEDNTRYTIIELTQGEETDYSFRSINANKGNCFSFGYLSASYTEISVVNEKLSWNIMVEKVSDSGALPLANARFAIYTKNETLAAGEDEELKYSDGADREITVDGTSWYLMYAGITDSSGLLEWEGLMEEEYYLLELESPNGYVMGSDVGQIVQAEMGKTVAVRVVNYTTYKLPHTGGVGIEAYTLSGLALIMAGTVLLLLKKRRSEKSR